MTMTASEMGKRSAAARRKKHGGNRGFAKHMSDIAKARYLDKRFADDVERIEVDNFLANVCTRVTL
jgi:hypothetical protein